MREGEREFFEFNAPLAAYGHLKRDGHGQTVLGFLASRQSHRVTTGRHRQTNTDKQADRQN